MEFYTGILVMYMAVFHVPIVNDSLFITIKLEAKYIKFQDPNRAVLLLPTPQK